MERSILDSVREAARKRILFLPHAIDEMNAPDELITPEDVERSVLAGQVVEDYPEDARGHSCLILGHGAGSRPIHVVCSPKVDYLAIITVYIPDRERWEVDFKTRRSRP